MLLLQRFTHSVLKNKDPKRFFPQKQNKVFIELLNILSPLISKEYMKLSFKTDEESLKILEEKKGARYVLLPNHSSNIDPPSMFLLGKQLGETFYYMADQWQMRVFGGELAQMVGAFSVRRGTADLKSLKYCVSLLSSPKTKMVIFPEGSLSTQNDMIDEIKSGAVAMAFTSQAKNPEEDLFLIPTAIKYKYKTCQKETIREMAAALEEKLHIYNPPSDLVKRIQNIKYEYLTFLEKRYNLLSMKHKSFDKSLDNILDKILSSTEQVLGIPSVKSSSHKDRANVGLYTLDCLGYVEDTFIQDFVKKIDFLNVMQLIKPEPKWTSRDGEEWTPSKVREALCLVLILGCMKDKYLLDDPSDERMVDTLGIMHRDIFNNHYPFLVDEYVSYVRVGEPINIKDYVKKYKKNKTKTIENLNNIVYKKMNNLLKQTIQKSKEI